MLQGGGDGGDGGEPVVREVQFHQAGDVEDLRGGDAAQQTTVTQTKVLQVEEPHESVPIKPREGVVG